ncbi:spermidine synthase [Actinacidiphila alni]|uniref:spermidine synthase n=1 Tax=Actinacidiphila alni TaxID=380248 RepID=UPI0034003F28
MTLQYSTLRGSADDHLPVVLDRREGPYGEVVLRRHGALLQIIANGCFLMDTSDGRSERLLVDAALRSLDENGAGDAAGAGRSVLIGGLGVGFSLAHAAAQPRWERITVVEREPAIVEWHRDGRLAPFSAGALDDPRVSVVERDLLAYLAEPGERHDALCLDIDNGPDWTVTDDNSGLYGPAGLAACRNRLAPGGVLAVWSAQPSAGFEDALGSAGFSGVRTLEVEVTRGVPDVVHLATKAA